MTHLLFDAAVAADGPQVLEGPPQEDDEEPAEESDHGGRQESPPHALTVGVARHVRGVRDDHVHPGWNSGHLAGHQVGHHGLVATGLRSMVGSAGASGCPAVAASGSKPATPQPSYRCIFIAAPS
ncbi:hypothetical protein MHYP_G00168390 [Metynnis hypsauchen]